MAQLAYPFQSQQLSEWCWCATAAAIAGWYRKTTVSQCSIAGLVISPNCCAGNVPVTVCNEPRPLDAPLRKTKNLAAVLDGSIALEQIAAMIEQGRPVGVRIQWSDLPGAGHMVALSGCDVTAKTVMVEDPKFGRNTHAYQSFRDLYLNHGFWSFTYLTRRQPDGA